METPKAVVAAAVCGPFVLTVVAIGLATTTLARRARRDEAAEDSGAGSKAAAALVASLLHVVPISLAQATDYASDVIVASSLLASGDAQQAALGWIAMGALGLSLVFAWVSLLGFACEETYSPYGSDHKLAPRQLLTAAVLAPFNLHVLYLGVVYSRAIAGADGNPKSQSAGWYFMFVTLKLLETSVESVPLAVVVVAAIVAGGGTGSVLLWASLSITCLSMSYGLFMQAMDNASDSGDTREEHQGQRLEIFLCVLIHLVWTVGAVGIAMGATELGVGRWMAPVVMLLLGLIQAVLAVAVEKSDHEAGQLRRNLHVFTFAGSVLDLPILFGGGDGAGAELARDHLYKRLLIFLARRLALAACAAVGLAFAWSPARAGLLGALLLLDTLAASPRLCRHFALGFLSPELDQEGVDDDERLRQILILRHDGVDLLRLLLRLASGLLALPLVGIHCLVHGRQASQIVPAAGAASSGGLREPVEEGDRLETGSATSDASELPPDASNDCAWLHDALEAIINGADPTDKAQSDLTAALRTLRPACKALDARLEQTSAAEQSAARTALLAYTPSEDGTAETTLLEKLTSPPEPAPPPQAKDAPGSEWVHPHHGTPLASALSLRLWTTVPSFFGRRVEGTQWHLSRKTHRVDWFVSHSWRDDGARKVAKLRELCFLQVFMARLVVVGLLLTLILGVCGLAIEEVAPAFPWWTLFASAGTVVATLLTWAVLSMASIVPSRLAPWATSSVLLWIDKCCINQETPETIKAGVDGFGRFLDSSDGMIAFVSSSYFSRIWCVYELASFCQKHRGPQLHEKLVLVSLEWPSSLSPLKAFFSPGLTDEERAPLTSFCCREAEAFKPCDRATVLAAIREKFGSEAAFDTLVRTELVEVLKESKIRYSTKAMQTMSDTLELTFGD